MRLFIVDSTNKKHYLNATAASRKELAIKLGSELINIGTETYHISKVCAEQDSESMPASTVIGGAIGLVAGMPGVLIGGALGAIFGNEADKKSQSEIEAFNRS
ncbi:hypothetical protein AN214_04012 [Pseudoalteromonas sp. P1-9]|nr:hypothetical protein AN214_04012 [Pseudoalteromonas sp. P1-9]